MLGELSFTYFQLVDHVQDFAAQRRGDLQVLCLAHDVGKREVDFRFLLDRLLNVPLQDMVLAVKAISIALCGS